MRAKWRASRSPSAVMASAVMECVAADGAAKAAANLNRPRNLFLKLNPKPRADSAAAGAAGATGIVLHSLAR